MEGWNLRPCVPSDVDKFWNKYSTSLHAWTLSQIKNELEKSTTRFWVMTDDETDEKISGFIIFSVVGEVCELMNVWVDTDFRRRGIATRMIEAIVRDAFRENVQKVWLEVAKSNAEAIALYQKLNFSVTRIRKNYYRNGDDAFEMELGESF